MKFLKAIIATWFILAAENNAGASASKVCTNSCDVIQGSIATIIFKLNLETTKLRDSIVALLAVITATSGELLQYRQLFTHRLQGSEKETAQKDFAAFLQRILGDTVKSSSQLSQILAGSLPQGQQIETLVGGVFNPVQETNISVLTLAQVYLALEPETKSLSGSIAALFQKAFASQIYDKIIPKPGTCGLEAPVTKLQPETHHRIIK